MSQRVAYVHLPRFPVQRRVLDEPGLAGQPLALVHETKGARRVAFASGTAQREGIRPGMTLTAARALLPALRDGPYDAVAEARALSSLAEGFLRFTPAFMLSAPDGLWLDASAASLFGGEAGLVEKVEAQARAAGYRARVALASEPLVTNQIEVHPFIDQRRVIDACRRHGMAVTAYSPLARGKTLDHPALAAIAQRHGKTPAQVMLRYLIEQGFVAIPRRLRMCRRISRCSISRSTPATWPR